VEFSKLTQDHIIGTKGEIATVSLSPNRGVNFMLQNDTAAAQNSSASWGGGSRIC
jgi:hypothetical protein